MKWITSAEHVKNFQVKITFNDNRVATIDFEKLLVGEIFEPLKDLEFFKKLSVHSELDVITWPNGADFAPDFLYQIAENQLKAS